MLNLYPGVERVDRHVGGAEPAAHRAAELARIAGRRGTFGVGGFLMRSDGRVIAEAVNRVIDDGGVDDPTAHVERQLVDWYLDARDKGLDLRPEELILVSSLDPCAMCAASIMSAGLTAVAVAEDPASGVHRCGLPHFVPPSLQAQAKRQLRLFATSGRDTTAGPGVLAAPIARSIVDEAEQAFTDSLSKVRRLISATDECEIDRDDIEALGSDQRLADLLGSGVSLGRQEAEAAMVASSVDRSVLIDPGGTVVLAVSSNSTARTRSSVVTLIRAYGVLRRYARRVHAIGLPHQRTCAIVATAAGFDDMSAMLSLGALGSALEDRPFGNPLPALGLVDREKAIQFASTLACLPPLYNDVLAISTGHVEDVFGRRGGARPSPRAALR